MNYFLFCVNKNNNNVNSRSDPRASFHVPLDLGILLSFDLRSKWF